MMKRGLFLFFLLSTSISALFGNQKEWQIYKKSILPLQKTFHGWCDEEKMNQMMNLIYQTRPKICVEIGVFGGSSVYPTAAALQYVAGGIIYAIDPWATQECTKGYDPTDANYQWWSAINLDEILADFKTKMRAYGVYNQCVIMRMTSEEALDRFDDGSIDILHIDGNHTEDVALNDIQAYFPKVKSGGYIWFDDANWSSTAKAIDFLMQNCGAFDKKYSTTNCLLFKKP